MKKLLALLIAAGAMVPLAGASDVATPFSIQIQGTTLHIFGPDGKEVGTGLPAPTIARTVEVPPYSFQVSFGADASGNLSAILVPDPGHPASVDFTVNDRVVTMNKDSVVTILLKGDLAAADPRTPTGVRGEDQAVPTQDQDVSGNNAPPYQMPSDVQGTPDARPPGQGQNAALSPLTAPEGNPVPPPFNTNKKAHDVLNVMTRATPTTPF